MHKEKSEFFSIFDRDNESTNSRKVGEMVGHHLSIFTLYDDLCEPSPFLKNQRWDLEILSACFLLQRLFFRC